MFVNKSHISSLRFLIPLLGLFFYSCANRTSGPSGGPKDTTPPRLMKSTPQNGQTNYNKTKISLEFDELVSLEKQAQKISVSPTQKTPPTIAASGKSIHVTLNDSLLPNTTYTINFGDAIIDNNEGNKLPDFSFAFSTGNELDSLQISGTVIDAYTHNPVSNLIIGIYSSLNSNAFTTSTPLRITKTDEKGHFILRNIKKDNYRIVALNDLNGNLRYDKNEGLAFLDKIITPFATIEEQIDTIKQKDKPDSLVTKKITVFSPSDIVLRYFTETDRQHYFVKAERKDNHKFTLFFNAPNNILPTIEPLNFDLSGNYLLEQNSGKDTLSYWLTESQSFTIDTLKFKLHYFKTDSLGVLQPATDTIRLGIKKEISSVTTSVERTRKKNVPQSSKSDFLNFHTNIKGKIDLNEPLVFRFDSPVKAIKQDGFSLYEQIDTIWEKISIELDKKDIGLTYQLNYKWESNTDYKLEIDSASVESIYGKYANKFSISFKTRALEEYSTLTIQLKNSPKNGLLEILTPDEKVVATKQITNEPLTFEYMNPGEYYLRIILDENNNGKYDAGKFSELFQPEMVYYFNRKVSLMANWEIEEEWDIEETPLLKQKPQSLIKVDKK